MTKKFGERKLEVELLILFDRILDAKRLNRTK